MPRKKISFNGKKVEVNETKVYKGTVQDLLKERATIRDRAIPDLEKLFDEWDGGGLVIVMNQYDENNHPTGAKVAVLGGDDALGIVHLAKAVHKASETIIEESVDTMRRDGGVQGMLELLKEVLDS